MKKFVQQALVASLSSLALGLSAQAADWPEPGHTVEVILPIGGGTGTGDALGRIVADGLEKQLNIKAVPLNKPGANGIIGATEASKAKADGYHLLFSWAGTLAVNPSMFKKLSYDPVKDFEVIGLVAEVPNILVINKDLPIHSVDDLVKYAKEHPNELNAGSTGIGSSMHLAAELFQNETGTKLEHVPYNSPAEGTTDMIGGDIQMMFQLVPGIRAMVEADRVRALAIMSEQRSPVLPDVPTMAEQGYPSLLSSTWFALLAPTGTPDAVLDKLNEGLNGLLKDEAVLEKLNSLGASPLGGTREQGNKHLVDETAKWAEVIEKAGIQKQ
ncbi:MAG: tripartite tricarboxylate transporter substrate binding protein [Castellaniella sp.]